MQDITNELCTNTSEGFEKQLKDARDGQLYYVGKMKDGKCWMLQNLALGSANGDTTLTSSDSNVTSDWSLPKSYATAADGSTSATAIQSWNFGKWVLATPLLTTSCAVSSGINDAPNLAYCTSARFVDVSNETNFQPTYTATTSSWLGANAVKEDTLVAVSCTSWSGSGTSKKCTAGTYDPHYLVGNYYSWYAATAGTARSTPSGEASGSICPKGWKLPTSNSTAVGSFAGLLSQYGVDSSVSGSVSGTTYNIAGSPLRFVRGGGVNPRNSIGSAGASGNYWSSTETNYADRAYRLNFNSSSVDPSNANYRYGGDFVRCIAE